MLVYYCALCMCYASTCAMSPPPPPSLLLLFEFAANFCTSANERRSRAKPTRLSNHTSSALPNFASLSLSLLRIVDASFRCVCVCVFAYSHRSCSSHVLRHTRGASHTAERGERVGRVEGGRGVPVRVLCVAFAVDFAANARSSDESGVRAKKHATKYSTHT